MPRRLPSKLHKAGYKRSTVSGAPCYTTELMRIRRPGQHCRQRDYPCFIGANFGFGLLRLAASIVALPLDFDASIHHASVEVREPFVTERPDADIDPPRHAIK